MKKENYTYGCDVCGEEKDWDEDIIWISSSFGVCEDCYDKIPQSVKDKIANEIYDNEVEQWLKENATE